MVHCSNGHQHGFAAPRVHEGVSALVCFASMQGEDTIVAPASHLARTYIPRLVKDKVLLEEGKVLRIRFNRNDGPVLAENLRREDAALADMCANVKECEGVIRPLFEQRRDRKS